MNVYSWMVLASFLVSVDATVGVINGEGKTDSLNTTDVLTRVRETFRTKLSSDLVWNADEHQIRLRRAVGASIYQQLAAMSGGTVFNTDKTNIGKVIDIIKETFTASLVTVMKFRLPSSQPGTFSFPVDDTMSDVIVKIQTTTNSARATFQHPSGSPELFTGTRASRRQLGRKLSVYNITTSQPNDYGMWAVTRTGTADWEVVVTGQSPVGFTYQLLEPGPGGFGNYPVKGRPVSGQSIKLYVDVPSYDKVFKVTTADFTDDNGKPLRTVPLTNVGGRRGRSKFTSGTIPVPSQAFHVVIHGQDKSGHVFTRQDPAAVTPLSLKLDVPFHTGTVYVGETVVVPYNVTNTGGRVQNVKIEITDSAGFSQTPTTTTATIAAGATTQGVFSLTAGPTPGVTTTVTITALSLAPGVTSGQYEIRRLTVQERPKSTTTPTTPMTRKQTTTTSATKMMSSSNGPSPSPTVTPVHSDTVNERRAWNQISTRALVVASAIALVGCLVPVLIVYLVLKRQASLVKMLHRLKDDRRQKRPIRAHRNSWF